MSRGNEAEKGTGDRGGGEMRRCSDQREKERERLVKRLLKTKKRISMKLAMLAMLAMLVVAVVVTGEQWYSAAVDTSSPSFPLRRRWW